MWGEGNPRKCIDDIFMHAACMLDTRVAQACLLQCIYIVVGITSKIPTVLLIRPSMSHVLPVYTGTFDLLKG